MILRRFMQHIREQNWFAVGLDVIVVIVGIFLGLQVQNWYEGRSAQDEEARTIANLVSDMEENAIIMERRILNSKRIQDNSKRVLEIFASGHLNPQETAQFERGLADFSKAMTIESIGRSINDDTLAKILNPQVRTIITDFQEAFVSSRTVRERVFKGIDAARMVTVSKAAVIDGPGGELVTYYNFENLKSDDEYLSALHNIYGSMTLQLALSEGIQNSVDLLTIALKQYQDGEAIDSVEFPVVIFENLEAELRQDR